jgi:broad specificity phosphatase PhoE
MTIIAARHGVTELNRQGLINGRIDEPLIEEGREQARRLRDALDSNIKRIRSSPLKRARETADIISQRFQLPVLLADALMEVDWGELTGLSYGEMEVRHGSQYSKDAYMRLTYNLRPFGGESVETVRFRLHGLIDEIRNNPVSDNGEDAELLVTHGGILRILEHDFNQRFISDMKNCKVITLQV